MSEAPPTCKRRYQVFQGVRKDRLDKLEQSEEEKLAGRIIELATQYGDMDIVFIIRNEAFISMKQ